MWMKGLRRRAIVDVHSAKGEDGIEVVGTLNDVRVKVVEYDGNHCHTLKQKWDSVAAILSGQGVQ